MDSHTVASRNSLCKLKNFIDEDCDLPHFIKNRFACGFPKDWVLLRRKWIMFLKAGLPAQIASKFKCGMPRFWHKVLYMWIVYADSIEGETLSSVINLWQTTAKRKITMYQRNYVMIKALMLCLL
ncbi:uncharacterized protein LOC126426993 [Schistocerca serialis cubense]|uniref:uncharacterized protein LOC126426993 n=2 Tax=Schistocerca TaxID=7008 RepID=UPI00214E547A|nr:uncharacterized protein LOC126426993 [Schistocerca serialis cubense]